MCLGGGSAPSIPAPQKPPQQSRAPTPDYFRARNKDQYSRGGIAGSTIPPLLASNTGSPTLLGS